jgi:hypothetical protein
LDTIILLSTLFSNTLSLCFSLNDGDCFMLIWNYKQNYGFTYFNFCVFRWQVRREKFLSWMVASMTLIYSALNFLMNQTLLCYVHSQIFDLFLILKGCLSHFVVIILASILVTSIS